jgi:adenine phosphoribosyltransferase
MAKASYIRLIDFNTPRNFVDVHPLYRDREAFHELIQDMASAIERFEIESVCGIQSQGFVLGTALAFHVGKPLVLIEKYEAEPKLPSYAVDLKDYSKKWKKLGLRRNSITRNSRCVLVDDWIETGAQMRCAMELVAQGGGVVACVAVIHADRNDFTDRLLKEGKLLQMDAQ